MNHHELKEGTFELSVPVSEICGAPARVMLSMRCI